MIRKRRRHPQPRIRVLVAGRAVPNTGVSKKLEDAASGIQAWGGEVHLVLVPSGRSGSRQFLQSLLKHDWAIIYLRQDYSILWTWPVLLLQRMRGVSLVLDVPTTFQHSQAERSSSAMSRRRRIAVDLANHMIAPFAWWIFHTVIHYQPENGLWYLVGNKGRMILTSNGIDVNSRPLRSLRHPRPGGEVRLLGLGVLWRSHGVDRLIHGIHQYRISRPDVTVRAHLTGPMNQERVELEDLIDHLGLSDIVRTSDLVTGEELDGLFDWADLGVGDLGSHRLNATSGYSRLKHHEYLARGLPVLYAGDDRELRQAGSVSIRVRIGDDPLDMEVIIQELDQMTSDPLLTMRCRDFAFAHFDVKLTVVPLVIQHYRCRFLPAH